MDVELKVGNKIDINKMYMVHLTNFFPRGRKILSTYDGNKVYSKNSSGNDIIVDFQGESKHVIVPSHRHTTHFTLNSVAEATKDGAGDWSECPMAIIEPFKNHESQFITYGLGDSYIWGSVDLSPDAVIIINQRYLELIPEEERESWNVLVTEDEISKAVKRYFKEKDIPVFEYEDHAGHQMGVEFLFEDNLQRRDRTINFIRNNSFDGKSLIEFSIEEFAQILNIQHDNKNMSRSIRPSLDIVFKGEIDSVAPREFYELIIANGFCIEEAERIFLKSDDDIYFQMLDLKKQSIIGRKECVEIETIYARYMEFIFRKSAEELTEFEKRLIEREKEKVKSVRAKSAESLSEFEIKMIERDNFRLLNSTLLSVLSDEDLKILKKLKPTLRINDEEKKYRISYVELKHQFLIAPSDDVYNYNEEQLGEISQAIFDKLKEYKSIVPNESSIGCLMFGGEIYDEFVLNVQMQQETETYGDYYKRIQNYIEGIQAIMDGKAVKISDNGIVIQDTELTLKEIGQGTINTFKQNPINAIDTMDMIEQVIGRGQVECQQVQGG